MNKRRGPAFNQENTDSSKTLFQKSITNFKTQLLERGYPENVIQTTLSEVTFEDRNQALRQKQNKKENLALCNAISPSSAYLKANTHEQLAFDNTATIAKRHFQGTAPNIVQKRAFPQRHTRENKTLERLKHTRAQEARRSVTLLDTKKRITKLQLQLLA